MNHKPNEGGGVSNNIDWRSPTSAVDWLSIVDGRENLRFTRIGVLKRDKTVCVFVDATWSELEFGELKNKSSSWLLYEFKIKQ